MTPKDVIKMAQENKAVMANFKFLDFPNLAAFRSADC